MTSLPLCTSDVSSFHFNLRILSSFIWNHSLNLYFRYLLQPSSNLKPTKTWSKSTLLKEMCFPYSLRYLKRYLHLLQLIPLINQKRRTLRPSSKVLSSSSSKLTNLKIPLGVVIAPESVFQVLRHAAEVAREGYGKKQHRLIKSETGNPN